MAVAKRIDMAAWLANYKKGTAQSGQKLVDKFNSRTGIVDAAISDAAVANFRANVVSDQAIAKRKFKLQKQGDTGLHAAMTKSGASAYTQQTANKADKAASGFAPFAPILEQITNSLPPRTSDPATNVTNRVTPIAVGLSAAKRTVYGA